MIKKEEIINRKDQFEKLAEKYNLSVILLYGSGAKGTAMPESDLDFAVKSDKKLDFSILYEIERAIAEFLQFPEIQIIDMKSVSENFLAEILPESIPLFVQDETAFDAFKIYIWKLNAESKWLRDMNYAYLKNNILSMAS